MTAKQTGRTNPQLAVSHRVTLPKLNSSHAVDVTRTAHFNEPNRRK